jgi:hypothetical protein
MRSEKLIESNLRDTALKEIKKIVKDKNKDSASVYEILELKDTIKYTNLDIKKV